MRRPSPSGRRKGSFRMNNKTAWRKGFGLAQIMAMIVVVIPTSLFIMTLLFDYWAAMQLDNRLKLMSHRAVMAINSAELLDNAFAFSAEEKALLQSLCPSGKATLELSRTGDMPSGQTQVSALVVYDRFIHLAAKELKSTITSYSYNDQNGSYQLECK